MSSAIKGLISQYNFYHSIYLQIIVAIITFFIVVIVGKLAIKFIKKLLEISNFDHYFKDITGIETLLAERIESFGKAIVYLVALISGLNTLNITSQAYTFALVFIIMIFIASMFIGIKDFIPNYYYGLKLKPKKYLKEGDKIRIKHMTGRVNKIKLNGLLIELQNKDVVFMPNLSITAQEIKKARI